MHLCLQHNISIEKNGLKQVWGNIIFFSVFILVFFFNTTPVCQSISTVVTTHTFYLVSYRIPSDESKILCGNIEGIVKFQETLYDQLKEVSEYVFLCLSIWISCLMIVNSDVFILYFVTTV